MGSRSLFCYDSLRRKRHQQNNDEKICNRIGSDHSTFVVPAWALEAGVYYVGLDTTTHTCSVMTEMKAGMKMMGKYKSKEEAEKAMAGMKECHA